MNPEDNLTTETRLLEESWKHISKDDLRVYLIKGFQNPRINIQSILTRHFLIEKLFGKEFEYLMQEEIKFSIEMNKIFRTAESGSGMELSIGPEKVAGVKEKIAEIDETISEERLDTFQKIWAEALSKKTVKRISVMEPACGSANDYRFLHSYGIARFLDYKGFDIAEPNIENAKQMFPGVRFEVGNVFDIDEKNESFDYLIVHDLFEHLSPVATEATISEFCRVVRNGMIVNFFRMSDIPDHKIKPLRKYHWNELSATGIKRFFKDLCKEVEVIRIHDMLVENYGYAETYNKKAYTFLISK